MPYEVLGVDISQPDGRDTYLEVFAYLQEREVEFADEEELGYGLLEPWIQSNPEEAKEFLTFCIEHDNPIIRGAAGLAVKDFLKIDPEFTLNTIEKLLNDREPAARRASGYYHDILGGEPPFEDFLALTGLNGVSRLIKAVSAAQNMDQAPTQS